MRNNYKPIMEKLFEDKFVFFQVHKSLGYPYSVMYHYNGKDREKYPVYNLLLGFSKDDNLEKAIELATFEAYANYKVYKDIGRIC